MNIIDVLIGAFVLVGAWSGFRKGLILSISKLVGYVIGLVVALSMYQSMAYYMGTVFGLEKAFTQIGKAVLKLPQNVALAPVKSVSMDKLQGLIQAIHLPESSQKFINDMLQQLITISGRPNVTTVGDAMSTLVGELLLKIVAFSILVLVVEVIISLAVKFISKLVSYTPAGLADKGGGLLFGTGKNILIVTITLIVLNPFLTLALLNKGSIGKISTGIQQSQFCSYVIARLQ
ncbi:MAG TPA: CvpA family protein [Bacillota bacterium]|nr:CvpA family protein [Bacillota bacterium]